MSRISRIFATSALVALMAIFTGCSDSQKLLGPDTVDNTSTYNSGSTTLLAAGASDRQITYTITLVDVSYDGYSTTFIWSVTSNPDGGPAISHLTFEFEEPVVNSMVSSSDPATETGYDPTTGVTGIKFDTGYDDQETRNVTLTLEGEWTSGDVTVAVKAGNGYVLGTVDGPATGGGGETVTISGEVFLDIDRDGIRDSDEPGIGGVDVSLSDGSSAVTGSDGSYAFVVVEGSYTVSVSSVEGLDHALPSSVDLGYVETDVTADFAYSLNTSWLFGQSADGFTIGYWKTNISKALSGKVKGTQVSGYALESYVAVLSTFAIEPLNFASLSDAFDVLSARGSDPVVLLSKQLAGSEFNYANGAYIGGNALFTQLLLWWGEYLIKHSSEYDSGTLLEAKDLFDAYNNSHGGAIVLQ